MRLSSAARLSALTASTTSFFEFSDDGLLDGLTTDVAAYEFVYNAYKGKLTRGAAVDPELIREFFDGFPHLFDPETTPRVSIGRNVVEQVWMLGQPVESS